MVITYGISAADFLNGLQNIPNKILLLNDDREHANSINAHTKFSIVSGRNAIWSYLLDKQAHNKKFTDFQSNEDLDTLLNDEIARLLYLGHMEVPIYQAFSSKLHNRYIYMTLHSNFLKTYYRKFSDFNHILELSLKRHMRSTHNGRRMFIRPLVIKNIDNKIILNIIKLSSEGVVIAFDHATEEKKVYHIPVWIEKYPERQAIWHTQRDVYQNIILMGYLNYDTSKLKWSLNLDSKKINKYVYQM